MWFPSGHFCPAGTALAAPCPIGTLGQITRAQSVAACVSCPTGLYCGLPGLSHPQGHSLPLKTYISTDLNLLFG